MARSVAVSLLVVAAAAALAPVFSELLKRFRIPSVLFELGLGILVGPSVLGWVEVGSFVKGLSQLGLAFLFFIAGYEINFERLKGQPIRLGLLSWVITLVLAASIGTFLALTGFVISSLLVGLALTTTSIGTLLPMLVDRGILETRFGRVLTAAGAVGEFGPIVAVTVLLGAVNPGVETLLLALFLVLAVAVAFLAGRPQSSRFTETMHRNLTTTSQMPVRFIMLVIAAMVALATVLGLDMLLGAFASGLIVKTALRPGQSEAIHPRLDSIGFGFLIPVFFVVSGADFNVRSLMHASTLIRVPIFLGLMLAVRGLPALVVYRKSMSLRHRSALSVIQSTGLPLVVVITQIGLASHQMRLDTATALVGAGMLSVLVFPLTGFAILGVPDLPAGDHGYVPDADVVLGRADLDPSVFPTDGRWIDEVEDPASDGL